MQAQATGSRLELKENLLRGPHGPIKNTVKIPAFGFRRSPASHAPLLMGSVFADFRFQPDCDVHISQSFSVSQHAAEQNNMFHPICVFVRAVHESHSFQKMRQNIVQRFVGEWVLPRKH
jgi:hypothetical protein